MDEISSVVKNKIFLLYGIFTFPVSIILFVIAGIHGFESETRDVNITKIGDSVHVSSSNINWMSILLVFCGVIILMGSIGLIMLYTMTKKNSVFVNNKEITFCSFNHRQTIELSELEKFYSKPSALYLQTKYDSKPKVIMCISNAPEIDNFIRKAKSNLENPAK